MTYYIECKDHYGEKVILRIETHQLMRRIQDIQSIYEIDEETMKKELEAWKEFNQNE